MREIWRDIKEYEGLYQVSTYGNIRSLNRYKKSSYNSKSKLQGIVRKPVLYKDTGYLSIILSNGVTRKQILVHRIVASTFLFNKENKKCVNHINGIRNDNNVENLEWATHFENYEHSAQILGTNVKSKPVSQYDLQGNFIQNFRSISEIEKKLGYSKANIHRRLKNGIAICYKHIWKYS
jgi:hypothetical protein